MASVNEEEKMPFLASEGNFDQQAVRSKRRPFLLNSNVKLQSIILVLHLLLLVSNIVLLISNAAYLRTHGDDTLGKPVSKEMLSPAESALQYITIEEHHYEHSSSVYTGEPRLELDQAWSDLLRSTNIRVTEEEMLKMNKTSLKLLDGSGYVGYLEALHMLHCVKRIYQSYHPEHYPEQVRAGRLDKTHLYHCLDVIREGIMCNADVTMNTFAWETPRKAKAGRGGLRKCTDWDSLQAWAYDREIAVNDMETFVSTMVVPFGEIGSIGPVELL